MGPIPCWRSEGVGIPSLTSAFSVSSTFCPLMSRWITLWAWRWARPWGSRGGRSLGVRGQGCEPRGGGGISLGWAGLRELPLSTQGPKYRMNFAGSFLRVVALGNPAAGLQVEKGRCWETGAHFL